MKKDGKMEKELMLASGIKSGIFFLTFVEATVYNSIRIGI